MTRQSRMATALLSAIAMIVLILDSRTAVNGAAEGIELCVRTVIPSLFPFFVLSILLTNAVSGAAIPPLSPIGRLCGIPKGAESLLIIGLLGGYPVGAQAVTEAYSGGYLTKEDAHRMLGFCSNAGPAFIFGIAGRLFSSQKLVILLWGIHILSALAVGILLPGRRGCLCKTHISKATTLTEALSRSLRIMASVCGWIILFRILIAFLDRWFLWMLPETVRLLLTGLLELANGCHYLLQSQTEALRFILCAVILGFGGICVSMQTLSVTESLGTGWYFPGKILQTGISFILAVIVAQFMYRFLSFSTFMILIMFFILMLSSIIFALHKKTVAFSPKQVYNI